MLISLLVSTVKLENLVLPQLPLALSSVRPELTLLEHHALPAAPESSTNMSNRNPVSIAVPVASQLRYGQQSNQTVVIASLERQVQRKYVDPLVRLAQLEPQLPPQVLGRALAARLVPTPTTPTALFLASYAKLGSILRHQDQAPVTTAVLEPII